MVGMVASALAVATERREREWMGKEEGGREGEGGKEEEDTT